MSGKLVGLLIAAIAAIAAGAMYYLQVYGFYYEVTPTPGKDVYIAGPDGQQAVPYEGFRAIDADSSPIRYRSCFKTDLNVAALGDGFTQLESAEPRVAPRWFDCFDAEEIGKGIETGKIVVFLAHKNIAYGVDRVVAFAPDGRGWAWHELNDCGHKAYDGTVVGEACPPAPKSE